MKTRALVINRFSSGILVGWVLATADYRVDVTVDFTAALAKLRCRRYDIIINVEGPGSESWRTCESLREVTAVPIIVISPEATADACVLAINAGADYFLRKPFGPQELLARIKSLRQRARLRPSPALP
jgi:DNA-binding response OmpR family regulator